MPADQLEEYYKRRANEYEEIYYQDDPKKKQEQDLIAEVLKSTFKGKKVIELAAGTGYWSRFIAQSAYELTITDAAEETLAIARTKPYGCPVEFLQEDAFLLSLRKGSFEGGAAVMWISHIPREKIDAFLTEFHRVLKDGATVFIADNVYDENSPGRFIAPAGEHNSYRLRKLHDGSEYTIMKNYYSPEELLLIFGRHDSTLSIANIYYGKKYWYVIYKLRKSS